MDLKNLSIPASNQGKLTDVVPISEIRSMRPKQVFLLITEYALFETTDSG